MSHGDEIGKKDPIEDLLAAMVEQAKARAALRSGSASSGPETPQSEEELAERTKWHQELPSPERDGRFPERDGRFPERDGRFPERDERFPERDGRFPERDGRFPERDERFPGRDDHDPSSVLRGGKSGGVFREPDEREAYRYGSPADAFRDGSLVEHRPRDGERFDSFRADEAVWRLVLPAGPCVGVSGEEIEVALERLEAHRNRFNRQEERQVEPIRFDKKHWDELAQKRGRDPVDLWADENDSEIEHSVYFLVAGGTEDVPFAVEHYLSHRGIVGRVAFDRAEDYRRYGERVLEAEQRGRSRATRPVMFFGESSDRSLSKVRRLTDKLAERLRARAGGARKITPATDDARWENLLSETRRARAQSPSLLFLFAHGLPPSRGPLKLGALVDQKKNLLTPEMIAKEPQFVEKGVVILSACYSGGATRGARAVRDGAPPDQEVEPCLPMAMLAHGAGPLAVLAHMDQLHTDALYALEGRSAPDPDGPGVRLLTRVFDALLDNRTVGIAMERIRRDLYVRTSQLERVGDKLYSLTNAAESEPGELSNHLKRQQYLVKEWLTEALRRWWIARGWILYGDPAVTLEGVAARTDIQDVYRGE